MSISAKLVSSILATKVQAVEVAKQQIAALQAQIEVVSQETTSLQARESELASLEAALTVQLQSLGLAPTVVQTTVEAQILNMLGVQSAQNSQSALARAPRESKDSLVERVLETLSEQEVTVKVISEQLDKAVPQVAQALDALVLSNKAVKRKLDGSRAYAYKKA